MLIYRSMLVASLLTMVQAFAGPVFIQPTNWYVVQPSETADKTAEIQAAINTARGAGGGTIYLPAGTFIVSNPLKILCAYATNPNTVTAGAVNIRILGALAITGHTVQTGETVLKWNGDNASAAVIEVTHAQNITLENLRITTYDGTRRFMYGIFFHRTDSASSGNGFLPAPTALNVIDCGITRGPGNFTVGYRINDPGPNGEYDQNCDMNYVENLWIQGATDDNGGTTANYQDGTNSCGLWIGASQVQAGYFRNINIDNCGTGVFVANGQIEVFGGTFSNNIQPGPGPDQSMLYDNHGSDNHTSAASGYFANGPGGGDFVFRTGFGGGQVIQDVTSTGSYRFITGYMENGSGAYPLGGSYVYWQSPMPIALAVVNCTILSAIRSDVVFCKGNGGPQAFYNCNFGGTGGTAQNIVVGQWTQGTAVFSHCKFNHSTGTFYSTPYLGTDTADYPRAAMLGCQGWNGSAYVSIANTFSDPADAVYADAPPAFVSPRARATDEPIPANGYVVNLDNFTYNGKKCNKYNGNFDNGPIINAAIADANAHGGGTVWFPSGAYVVRTPLLIQDASDVRLLGTGGRNGYRDDGRNPTVGVGINWDGDPHGTVLTINRSRNISVKSVFFSTWYGEGQTGVTHCDNFIRVSQTGSGGYPTQNIWFEDTGTAFMSSNGPIRENGVCDTFIRIGDGPGTQNCTHITAIRVGANRIAQQIMYIDGPSCTDIQCLQFGGTQTRRIVHISPAGGAFAWFGGGGGNNLWSWDPPIEATYSDPVVVELENATGPIYITGRECQDNYPTRVMRTSTANIDRVTYPGAGQVYIYGDDWSFYAPKDDQKQVDFKFTGSGTNRPELYLFGCMCGWVEAVNNYTGYEFTLLPPKISVANGSSVFSFANLFPFRCNPIVSRPWLLDENSSVEDLGSRFCEKDYSWPWDVRNGIAYSSTYGSYSLSPYVVTPGQKFKVTWSCAAGDTTRTGDNVSIFAYPGYGTPGFPGTAPLSTINLVNASGQYAASGTTRDNLTAPAAGIYELRYYKTNPTRCAHKQMLVVTTGTTNPVVQGTVSLGDYTGSPAAVPVTVEVRDLGAATAQETYTVNLDTVGHYALAVISNGPHDLTAKASHWLRNKLPGVNLTGAVTANFSLINGDANRDNVIDPADLAMVLSAMDGQPGDLNYVAATDLNGDEAVTSTDLSTVLTNLDRQGD